MPSRQACKQHGCSIMVDKIVTKPLGLVLIAVAHVVFSGPSRAEVTGILGTNITLQFTFNISVTLNSSVSVYRYITGQKKIAQYSPGKHYSERGVFYAYPKNTSVFCHITNLKINHSGRYWASLFMASGLPTESNKVQLIVREDNGSSTVPPMQNNTLILKDNGSSSSFHIVAVLVVSSVLLLAATLPWLIWCLLRSKDKQQQPPQQSSTSTIQETVEASSSVPATSLVYSVLDFPKRSSTVLEIDPNNTEYAAVSYLPEKRAV